MTVPVLDLSAFRDGTARDKRAVAADFDRACRDIGFLLVSGHDVPESVQTALSAAGKAFFDHTSHLRLLHYPAPEQELESGQLRCRERGQSPSRRRSMGGAG